jgi:uncharacterized membrane protein
VRENEPLYSKVKIAGHPLHPMLVAFPVAFYVGALLGFVAYTATENPFWFQVGYVSNAAGVVGALLAAVPGFIDWATGIPRGTRAKRDGVVHMVLNVTALLLFAINLLVSRSGWASEVPDAGPALGLSLLGVLCTVGAGWFGWKLVQTHHVGVQPVSEAEALGRAPGARAHVRPQPTR